MYWLNKRIIGNSLMNKVNKWKRHMYLPQFFMQELKGHIYSRKEHNCISTRAINNLEDLFPARECFLAAKRSKIIHIKPIETFIPKLRLWITTSTSWLLSMTLVLVRHRNSLNNSAPSVSRPHGCLWPASPKMSSGWNVHTCQWIDRVCREFRTCTELFNPQGGSWFDSAVSEL